MKNNITHVLTSTLLLIGTSLLAQKGNIKGLIKTSDGHAGEFVTVGLQGTNHGTSANSKGEFELRKLEPGSYVLITSFIGLEKQEIPVEVKANETTVLPEIILTENAQTLKEIIVSSTPNKYNKTTPSSSLRLNEPLIEIPQNVQIVTTDALKDQQIISMSDGLTRNVSGLTKFEHWGDMYANIQTRGSQVQAFRNGFNVVNSSWGPLTEDMSFVDHIEFVKGPAGFMLSNGDPSGLYNVVTKKPTGQNKGEASLTLGSFDLYRATVDLDGKLSNNGKLLYRLNVSAQTKKSHRQNEFNDRYVIAPVISYQLDEHTKLTAEYNYQRANMSNVGSYYVFTPDGFGTLSVGATALPSGIPATTINDHSFYLNLQHDFNKNWKITTQLSQFMYDQIGTSMWAGNVNPDGTYIRNVSIWDAKSTMTMGQVFVNGDFTTGPVRHRILTGLDMANKSYMADWGQSHDLDSANALFDPKNPYLGKPVTGYPQFDRSKSLEERAQDGGGLMDLRYSSLYLQDELGFLNNRIRLTLAGRYTYLLQANWGGKPDTAQHVTPRIGLSGTITKDFTMYLLYDQAFIPQSGRLTNGNKVKPITGNNMEVGLKKSWFDGKWNTTVSVYRILKNNELTPDPNSPPTSGLSVELGQKQAEGIEFDLQGSILKGLDLIVNYAHTDCKVVKVANDVTVYKVGDNLPGYARQTANIWLSYKIQRGFLTGAGISAGASWQADRTSVGESYWGASNTKKMADYMKVDGGIFYEKGKIRITANMFNVMNAYLYSGAYYQYSSAYYYQTEAPRNGRISIHYKF
jgi:iron complex outermembrane receptor protein